MTRRSRRDERARRPLARWLAMVCLALGMACMGCGGPESPPADVSQPEDEQPAAPAEPSAETAAAEEVPSSEEAAASVEAPPGETAADVLQKMAAAYREASSYADAGKLILKIRSAEAEIDESHDFSVTLVRPDKIRAEIYEVKAVCDGQTLHAAVEDLPDQVLQRPAPAELTVGALFADPMMTQVLATRVGLSPPFALLLEDDAVSLLFDETEELVLGEPGTIDGHDCYRVESPEDAETPVFWIDQQTYVLRRIVFPTEHLRQRFATDEVAIVAEFEGAQFDIEPGPNAFRFEVPSGAQLVRFFREPHPAELLGKQVPAFEFVDLEGDPVTPESLAGKVVVLKFWATWCPPCRISFPILEEVRLQYADNDQIAFLAVSVDAPEVGEQELRDTLASWDADTPIFRDPDGNMNRLFKSSAIPTEVVIDAKGVVQHVQQGIDREAAEPAAELSAKLEKVLAGEDIYRESIEAYENDMREYERQIEAELGIEPFEIEPSVGAEVAELEIPQASVAERSEPETFRLTRVWECTELESPGNILVVGPAEGPARLLVVDAGRSVAELGLDGEVLAVHPLDLEIDPATERRELATNLRTAVGADGRRTIAAFAGAQQRFHLLDEDGNHVLSYPQDALENRHAGIADVELADLDEDGTLEAFVGYWGVVGVQGVSLGGERLWSNRSIANVERIAIVGPDDRGPRRLLCTGADDQLVAIGPDGRRLGELPVAGRLLHSVVAADLSGDGRPELCALAAESLGENVALGLSLDSAECWSYPLPRGVFETPVEPIIAGRLLPGTVGQWLLVGADGSIHVISPDGRLLDRFNYGAPLAGLATAELGTGRLLIASTQNVLEAWKVEP